MLCYIGSVKYPCDVLNSGFPSCVCNIGVEDTMTDVNLAGELVRVAKEVMADEYPVGMSDKGKEALGVLKKGIADKMLYNADYEEIKFRLSRDFEKSGIRSVSDPALSNFLYHASDSLLSLNSINKYARDVRKFIQKRDMSPFFPSPQYPREQNESEKKIVENWDFYAAGAEKYVREVETWLVVVDLLKEVKPYVVKGRKPIERGPDYVPRVYVPPMAGSAAVNLVQAKLVEIVEAQRAGLVDKITNNTVDSLSKYAGTGSYDEIKKFLHSVGLDNYFNIAFESAAVDFATRNTFALKKDYQDSVRSSVERGVQDMVERYVAKNTGKVAPIIHAKGEPSGVKVRWGNLQGWGFAGSIQFEFQDGTGFTVDNQAVLKYSSGGRWSGGGKPFYQFPTTFHSVKFKDGSVKSMVPEQAMNEVWAKEA